jgi:hypothetical protein
MNLSATLAPNGRTMADLDVPDASEMRECRVIVACPMVMMIDQPCVNVTIVDASLLVRTALNGSGCCAEISCHTCVSCTTIRFPGSRRRSPHTEHWCFVFQLFRASPRCCARGPPSAIPRTQSPQCAPGLRSRYERADQRLRTIPRRGSNVTGGPWDSETRNSSSSCRHKACSAADRKLDHENPHSQRSKAQSQEDACH